MKLHNLITKDGVELNGFLYQASNEPSNKIILSVHGMSSNCFSQREQIAAKISLEKGIDYFCFNNRGAELAKYLKKQNRGKLERILGGTSYEEVLESHYDVAAAIRFLVNLGYTNIYLQGHSLGATKVVYTYTKLIEEKNELIENISGVILCSLLDIRSTLRYFLNDKYMNYVEKAKSMLNSNNNGLMPKDSFIHPISAKTFLRYSINSSSIDCANYSLDSKLEMLNKIDKPLFMRWGTENELILQKPDELTKLVSQKLSTSNKDINYILGATHNYSGKEEELINQIIEFMKLN